MPDDHPPLTAVAAVICHRQHPDGWTRKAGVCCDEHIALAGTALRALATDPAVASWAGHLVRQAVAKAHAEARGGMPCSKAADVATECLLAALAPPDQP